MCSLNWVLVCVKHTQVSSCGSNGEPLSNCVGDLCAYSMSLGFNYSVDGDPLCILMCACLYCVNSY